MPTVWGGILKDGVGNNAAWKRYGTKPASRCLLAPYRVPFQLNGYIFRSRSDVIYVTISCVNSGLKSCNAGGLYTTLLKTEGAKVMIIPLVGRMGLEGRRIDSDVLSRLRFYRVSR